jgi:glycosyltransferase involved in cell wall biosynthesis
VNSRAPESACELSIVLCTYNRAELLGRALDALVGQTLDPRRFEVIVVDNNSNDATPTVVRNRAERHSHLRYLFEPRQGLPVARNSGVVASRAPLIAFTDDDVEVDQEWAAAVLSAFARYPDVGYIGGKVVGVWDEAGRPAWVPSTHYGPLALQDLGNRTLSVGSDDARPCLIGANFAVRRSVFRDVGLFSPVYPWGEDREFQLRAWDGGIRGLYVPDLVARCRVPVKRLTKTYQRQWFANAGRVHARMRLLERMDRDGRLMPPIEGSRVFGVPGYLFRELAIAVRGWIEAVARLRRSDAFRAETRIRYLCCYIAERRRQAVISKARGKQSAAGSHRQFTPAAEPPPTLVDC